MSFRDRMPSGLEKHACGRDAVDHGDIIRGSPNERTTMKRTILQKVQYLIQERDHERAMREVLQLIKPSAYANNRELMTEAAKLRGKYSTHAICDALQIDRGTFYNHIFRSKGKNSVYAIHDRQLSEEIEVISFRSSSLLVSTSSDLQQANVSIPRSQHRWSCRHHCRE